jgi:hypothetical protein
VRQVNMTFSLAHSSTLLPLARQKCEASLRPTPSYFLLNTWTCWNHSLAVR